MIENIFKSATLTTYIMKPIKNEEVFIMDNKIVKTAAYLIVGSVAISALARGAGLVADGVSKMMYNRKIKKGLKNGSIVEIDGKYYEVEVNDVEEA